MTECPEVQDPLLKYAEKNRLDAHIPIRSHAEARR